MPKIYSNYICQAVVLIGFILKRDKNYYSQVFLKEKKAIRKNTVWIYYCNLKNFSVDFWQKVK